MNTFAISYDLNKPGQNYESLFARLVQHGAFRVQLSQWALATTWTAAQLRDDLMRYIDANDRLLVIQIGNWASFNLLAGNKLKEIAA